MVSGSNMEVTASENARSATKELDKSDESKSTRLCQRPLEISEENKIAGNTKDKHRRPGIFIYLFIPCC